MICLRSILITTAFKLWQCALDLFLVFQATLMKNDTQTAASKATYVQSENIIYSMEFKKAIFCLYVAFILYLCRGDQAVQIA